MLEFLGPIASIAGALIGGNSASKAAKAQAAATQAGISEQQRQFDLTREDYAPYRAAGVNALQSLATDINRMPTHAEVMSDPGYQFGMKEGERALNRRIAAGGGRISGAAIRAGQRYAQDYATAGYGAAYQRRQDRLNRLAALAGIGQTATGGSAMAGMNAANQISGMRTSLGDAMGASKVAQGSIWGNAINQLGAYWPPQSSGSSYGPVLDPFFFGGNRGSGD